MFISFQKYITYVNVPEADILSIFSISFIFGENIYEHYYDGNNIDMIIKLNFNMVNKIKRYGKVKNVKKNLPRFRD